MGSYYIMGSKGFGFVEMDSDVSTEKAISLLDGQELDSRDDCPYEEEID